MEMVKGNQVLKAKNTDRWRVPLMVTSIYILDTGKEKLSELGGRPIETSQIEMQKWTTKSPEYSRIVGQFGKVTHILEQMKQKKHLK